MTRPAEIPQGDSRNIIVRVNEDVTAATEIEYRIDSNPQVIKTLSSGQIGDVTAAQFRVTLDSADTEDISVGAYKHQARVTLINKKYTVKFTPNKLRIIDSVFVDDCVSNDYN